MPPAPRPIIRPKPIFRTKLSFKEMEASWGFEAPASPSDDDVFIPNLRDFDPIGMDPVPPPVESSPGEPATTDSDAVVEDEEVFVPNLNDFDFNRMVSHDREVINPFLKSACGYCQSQTMNSAQTRYSTK